MLIIAYLDLDCARCSWDKYPQHWTCLSRERGIEKPNSLHIDGPLVYKCYHDNTEPVDLKTRFERCHSLTSS